MLVPLEVVTSCDGCGACCTEQAALPVHMVGPMACDKPVNPLPEELETELIAQLASFALGEFPPDGSPCIWWLFGIRCWLATSDNLM